MVSPVVVGAANGESGQRGDGMQKTPETNAVSADADRTAPVRVATQKGVADDRSSREHYAETVMNWSLLDPSRWGWTACGGISNVQSPDHIQPAPKMVATIVVEFPLEHHSPNDDDDDNLSSADRPRATFRDAISWDLSDPETPSPMAFAMSVGQEWGLPFAPTMDLAASIERQIDAHVAQHCQFTQPVTLRDPYGQERDKRGPMMQAYRYDPVVRTGKEGMLRPAMAKRNDFTRQTTGGLASGSTSLVPLDHERNAFSKQANKQRGKEGHMGSGSKSTKKAAHHVLAATLVPEVDAKYSNEVKERLCQASTSDVQERCKKSLFMLERIPDTQCHICHKKKDVVFGFGCGLRKHFYCKFHVETRLGLEADEAGEYVYQTCPVCTLECTCALCTRKLRTLSAAFKASCEAQRTSPNMTNFPNILTKAQSSESSREIRTIHKTATQSLSRNAAAEDETHASAAAATSSPYVPKGPAKGLAKGLKIRRMVPQPSISDFPQEIHNGRDLELQMLEWTDDYFTVFSTAGRQLVDSLPDAWIRRPCEHIGSPLSNSTGLTEDGNFLNQKVKDDLIAYHQSCRDDRQKTSRPGSTKLDAGVTKADALRMWKPSSTRMPLKVKIMRLSSMKPVALLDPVSRRVVKIYGSIHHASKAVEMMHQTDYPCEYNAPGITKKVLQKSAVDPYKLIFGYRWLYLEDLRAGKVAFLSRPMPLVDAKILKKDLVTGSLLAGFQGLMEAHLDWKMSLLSSPTVTVEESKLTVDHFEAEYLNGNFDVDGVVWFMTDKMPPEPKLQPYPPSQAEVPSTSSNKAEVPAPQVEQVLEPTFPAQGEMDNAKQDEAMKKRKRDDDDEGGGNLEVSQ